MAYTDLHKMAYTAHKGGAKYRSIPFLLTYAEWSDIWKASGKWLQRGWRRGQYVMARYGDKGAYEVGNVRICLAEENRAERNRNYPQIGHHRNPYMYLTDEGIAARNAKARQSMILVLAKANRKRDLRGCFLPQEDVTSGG